MKKVKEEPKLNSYTVKIMKEKDDSNEWITSWDCWTKGDGAGDKVLRFVESVVEVGGKEEAKKLIDLLFS
jgi:hypothetical protein